MDLSSTIARGNTELSACPSQSSMVELLDASESHVHCPILGIDQVYVAIKQVVALCLQTPFKCSIAGPPQSLYWQHDPGSHFKTVSALNC